MSAAVLQAVLRSALDATGADQGWVVARHPDVVVVLAAEGGSAPAARVGRELPDDAPAVLALLTGRPSARRPRGDDRSAAGAAGFDGVPGALLTVPCGDDAVIELVRVEGESFGVDDIEIVTLLAEVVAAAVEEGSAPDAPTPEALGAELRRLHDADRARYAFVARALGALLGVS